MAEKFTGYSLPLTFEMRKRICREGKQGQARQVIALCRVVVAALRRLSGRQSPITNKSPQPGSHQENMG